MSQLLKQIDILAEINIKESTRTRFGGVLTLLGIAFVLGYATFSYIQQPILVDSMMDLTSEDVMASITCKCLHGSGCVFMSACRSLVDEIKMVPFNEVGTVSGCRNISNSFTFSFRPKQCVLEPAPPIPPSTTFACYPDQSNCRTYSNCTQSFYSAPCMHYQNSNVFSSELNHCPNGNCCSLSEAEEFDNDILTKKCYTNGATTLANVAKITQRYRYRAFVEPKWTSTSSGFRLETIPLVDCEGAPQSNGYTKYGTFTLVKTKYRESGKVVDEYRYIGKTAIYDNYRYADVSRQSELVVNALKEDICTPTTNRKGTSYNMTVSDEVEYYSLTDSDVSIVLNNFYVLKEVSLPWLTLIGLVGGSWGAVFGAFSLLMHFIRRLPPISRDLRNKRGDIRSVTPQDGISTKTRVVDDEEKQSLGGKKKNSVKASSRYEEAAVAEEGDVEEEVVNTTSGGRGNNGRGIKVQTVIIQPKPGNWVTSTAGRSK